MTTLSDVAQKTGVSVATVSRVLNGYKDVNAATRLKVQRAIAELGYGRGTLGKVRDSERSMAIGIFYSAVDLAHPFFRDVLASFNRVVGRQGFDACLFALNSEQSSAEDFSVRAMERSVDGILLVSVPRTDSRIAGLSVGSIPCISIDLDLAGARAGYVCSDNLGGACQAVEYLIQMGHSRIAFIGDKFHTKPGHDRLVGYQRTLEAHGLRFHPNWVLDGDFSEAGGFEAANRLLVADERPTAIFCAGDLMALGAMRAISEAGLRVGPDISVIGFDDIELARYVTPSLTTVRQHREEIGERSAQCLLGMIQSPELIPPIVTVPTELVVRESVSNPTP